MRQLCLPLLAIGLLVAGCSGSSSANSTATAPPTATQTTEAASSAAPTAMAATSEVPTVSASATASPTATPTIDPNLLSWKNGAVVRAYPSDVPGGDVNSVAARGPNYSDPPASSHVFVYELAAPTAISAFAADLPAAGSTTPSSVTFAVSSSSATSGFTNAGTLTAAKDSGVQRLGVSASGRWVQVTATGPAFNGISAEGTLPSTAPSVSPNGIYVELDASPYKNGAFNTVTQDQDPWYRRIVIVGNSMTATRCFNGHYGAAYPGTLDGRAWTFHQGNAPGRAIVNEDASMIVGDENGDPFYLQRSSQQPKYCEPFASGSGRHHVLVLDSQSVPSLYPIDQNAIPEYSYERIDAGLLEPSALAGKDLTILNTLCDASLYLAAGQTDALLQWVAAGNKLLIVDSDGCEKSKYDFLPYPFLTSNPGARGAKGDRLIVVEPDALGTTDRDDAAHYFDPATFINGGSNQLGDANIVTTQDSHWCGHFFGTNSNQDNGFMQMYAPYQKGLLIYDGFDHDDGGNPGYQRVRQLEMALPLPIAMPCTQSVALAFLIQPNQEASFISGSAKTVHATMETLANLGWKGHIAIETTGDFAASVTPSEFDMTGGTQALAIAVNVPASAKPGAYTVNVVGDAGNGQTAQASITLTGSAPLLKKASIQKHQRIRIYGIHFDYDSARIEPRSEPVIADIAALMRANPTFHFEVSGHTDSDGGPAYNLGLSQRRAQSVVNDLVTRYGIARSRLVAKGYGLSRPVAPNSTAAGKALNRRVELERLQ